MTVSSFLLEKPLTEIPEFRRKTFEKAESHKVLLFQEKFWDLFALSQGQWHYITTKKIKPKRISPGQIVGHNGNRGYVVDTLENGQSWVRLFHNTSDSTNSHPSYLLLNDNELTPENKTL
jgi:hypothetical protein